ncbi:2-C-methyl-D-erythritol 4-phosphate cytidylyltransferase [Aurantibacillus circumpalustris]|uniref:2-C-methyl-D-erythritol 4-phosphate cytidylyltransferase n=1 Tax=Aurantibacillus circumpalustris TaxID=3036359 RepID=UPI00295ABAA0|nr:2-C-methyl-D-erythritol 4-phosphate cytidylyltransferase [Aurantibacillus circumpalustris]
MQEEYVIIVAGGVGSRMKSDRPKQFIDLGGEPIIVRTIRCFLNYNSQIQIIISVHKNYKAHLEGLIEKFNLKNSSIKITFGGETRFASVKNGLDLITNEAAIVGIHDAARPFVSLQTIHNCYETALSKGAAVPCISVNESMRKISNNVNNSVNRNEYKIIQTPQCFLVSKIKSAFQQEYSHAFTDDATVLESIGEKIILVEGNEENIKITSPHDLLIAKALLAK